MDKDYKYICVIYNYPNCRTHDVGYYGGLQFFSDTKDMLDWAWENKNESEIIDVRLSDGSWIGKILFYEYSSHRVSGIRFHYGAINVRTVDDGRGNIIWEKVLDKTEKE